MSNGNQARTGSGLLGTLGGGFSVAAAPFTAIARAIIARRQLARLEQLDDFILADIGITRSDIIRARLGKLDEDPMRFIERSRGAR